MNLIHRILDSFSAGDRARRDSRLRISNLTRQTVLAHCVEVADHGATRSKGLLGRDGLPAGEGLWIVPCEAVHTFGMKFPIDLVYLDRDKRVKKVRHGVPPWRLSACLSAHSVLELASGSIHRAQTQPGDKLEFSSAWPPIESQSSPDASGSTLRQPGDNEGGTMTTQPKNLRAIVEFLVICICTLAFVFIVVGICTLLLTGNSSGNRDFVSYWAAGHQLAQHANPYDADSVLRMERSAGLDANSRVILMRNPPSALLLVLPLSFFGLRSGSLFWSLVLVACLIASVRMLWVMHGRPKDHLVLLGYTFGPALACLLAGQTSLFALLGLVLFLRLHRTRPFLSGISLWLCALKPHLFLPFGIALLAWIIAAKCYRILLGAMVALATSTAIVFLLDPVAWSQYRLMMTTWGIEREFIPCLSAVLRLAIDPHAIWMQSIPTILGCAWTIHYFWRHRDRWDWMEHVALLILVSVLVAPYAWFTDQALIIPALLQAAFRSRSRNLIAVLAFASAVIEVELLWGVPMHSALYLWTAPAWLAWYLWAMRPSHTISVNGPLTLADGARRTTGKVWLPERMADRRISLGEVVERRGLLVRSVKRDSKEGFTTPSG